ncbi:MAG: hypothetical protein ACE5JI_19460 [Acidobacteriota bacterium]
MKRTIYHSGLACLLCFLVIPAANGQLRSPDPYQRDSLPQREQQDQRGMRQPRGPGQGQRQGGVGRRPDDMRRTQGGAQRGPQGGGQQGPGGGQGGGMSRNPVILALDTNRDGELSASEIANAAASLKTLDRNGDGNLSRDEMRPAEPRGTPSNSERNRRPANQARPPQGNARPPMSTSSAPRTEADTRSSPQSTTRWSILWTTKAES